MSSYGGPTLKKIVLAEKMESELGQYNKNNTSSCLVLRTAPDGSVGVDRQIFKKTKSFLCGPVSRTLFLNNFFGLYFYTMYQGKA